jgi:hypothetical protein
VTPTKYSKGPSMTQEYNENVEFKVSKLEEKITSMDGTMVKKLGILNMVTKKNSKLLKRISNIKDMRESLFKELRCILTLNLPL